MRRPTGRLRLPRPHVPGRALLGAIALVVLLIPGWLWLKDSSLVGVSNVTVAGVDGPQAAQIRSALEDAAKDMTTLDVDRQALRDAVAQFPVVASVDTDAHPLHRLDIVVHQHVAVAALANGDARMAVAADGTILEGTLTKGLPLVPVSAPPGGSRVAEGKAKAMVTLLGAAPAPLRARISGVEVDDHGLVAQVDHGPQLYFGPPANLQAKWMAATRVLGDYAARGAAYLDVRVPERPAAGGFDGENAQSEVQASQ